MEAADVPEVRRMRRILWPTAPDEEVDELLDRDDYIVLVADNPEGGLLAFAEVGQRSYAEGCKTSPVGYLEGIWVEPSARRTAVGRQLVMAGIDWARDLGLTDFASDCAIHNEVSFAFHVGLGFRETDRIICFAQTIPPAPD